MRSVFLGFHILFTQPDDCFFNVSVSFGQSFLAIHHSGAGFVTQLTNVAVISCTRSFLFLKAASYFFRKLFAFSCFAFLNCLSTFRLLLLHSQPRFFFLFGFFRFLSFHPGLATSFSGFSSTCLSCVCGARWLRGHLGCRQCLSRSESEFRPALPQPRSPKFRQ